MTVMVPCENAHRAGLRRVIGEDDVKRVIDVLTGEVSDMPKNWNRRFKYNREKIKTGDVFELAEVVRNLAIREWEKGLSTGEKQMYTRAKKILASEFMYARDTDAEGAEEYIDGLLEERFGDKAPATACSYGRAGNDGRDDRCRRGDGGHRGRRLGRAPRGGGAEGPRRGRRAADARLVPRRAGEPPRASDAIVVAAPAGQRGRGRGSCAPDGLTYARRRRRRDAARSRCAAAARGRRRRVVAIHDAARPLLTPELVDELVAKLAERPDADAVIAAAPLTDTVKRAREPRPAAGEFQRGGPTVAKTESRDHLWAAQTPQVFRIDPLREALAADPQRLAAATDEAMLVEKAGGKVLIHPAPART